MSRPVKIFQSILKSPLFRKTLVNHLGTAKVVVVERPRSFIIRAQKEGRRVVQRLIVLPPKGCSADRPALLNPHPEARRVKAYIYGEIDPLKKGYRPFTEGVIFRFSKKQYVPTQQGTPYALYQARYSGQLKKSWKNWFYIVKESGWGNFHNLINPTRKWIVLAIEKQLLDRKPIDIQKYLKQLAPRTSVRLSKDIKYVIAHGDSVFEHEKMVRRLLDIPPKLITPILIQLLNVAETGEHQNCTFFALILKVARQHKLLVQNFVREAIIKRSAPYYYLADLEKKLL